MFWYLAWDRNLKIWQYVFCCNWCQPSVSNLSAQRDPRARRERKASRWVPMLSYRLSLHRLPHTFVPPLAIYFDLPPEFHLQAHNSNNTDTVGVHVCLFVYVCASVFACLCARPVFVHVHVFISLWTCIICVLLRCLCVCVFLSACFHIYISCVWDFSLMLWIIHTCAFVVQMWCVCS